jgi:hypothetical protein
MKIYAVVGYAEKKKVDDDSTTIVNAFPFGVKAPDAQRAEAEGMVYLLEYCPLAEGWLNHSCRAIEIPHEWYKIA